MTKSTAKQQLLENIHSDDRYLIDSSLFREPTKVVRLLFMGAPNYFITDKGYIYNRKANNTNRSGILTRGYLPLTHMDMQLPYPWVRLPTDFGTYWFPVNQLLGWAFNPIKDVSPKAYVTKNRIYTNSRYDDYEWIDELPHSGFFKSFMSALYS